MSAPDTPQIDPADPARLPRQPQTARHFAASVDAILRVAERSETPFPNAIEWRSDTALVITWNVRHDVSASRVVVSAFAGWELLGINQERPTLQTKQYVPSTGLTVEVVAYVHPEAVKITRKTTVEVTTP